MKKELEELEAAMKKAQESSVANQTKKAEEAKKAQAEEKEEEPVQEITIDDFDKIKLKVGTVIASEKMKGS